MAGVKGRSGRLPKSAEQHRLDGTKPKPVTRQAIYRPAAPPPGVPKAPGKLSLAARKEWDRMVGLLKDTELLALVDGAMLYHYCQAHAGLQDTQADLARVRARRPPKGPDGTRAKTEIGRQVVDLNRQLTRQRNQVTALLEKFGLSPAARSRMGLSPAGAGLPGVTGAAGAAQTPAEPVPIDDMAEFDTPPPAPLALAYRREPADGAPPEEAQDDGDD